MSMSSPSSFVLFEDENREQARKDAQDAEGQLSSLTLLQLIIQSCIQASRYHALKVTSTRVST